MRDNKRISSLHGISQDDSLESKKIYPAGICLTSKIVLKTSGGSYMGSWGLVGNHSTLALRMKACLPEMAFECAHETWTSDPYWVSWATKFDAT